MQYYFSLKHDIRSDTYKSPNTLEMNRYKKPIIDWLFRRFDIKPFDVEHTQWISYSIWDGNLSISFDFRQPSQKKLFDLLPDSIKGIPRISDGKMVNLNTLYFNVNDIRPVIYPDIISKELLIKDSMIDDDGDTFYEWVYKVKLSDDTFVIMTTQKEGELPLDFIFKSKIESRTFYHHLTK